MHRRITSVALGAALGLALVAGPVAAGNPSGSGQPNASCEEATSAPNGFSSQGFANAELNYAGNGAGSLHANSANAVSQYDVACYQVSLHH
jgi:hypothetical protein